MFFSIKFPRRVIFGRGSLERLPDLLDELELRGKAMLVSGRKFARESGYLEKLRFLLNSAGIYVVTYDRVEPNPSVETVENGAKIAKDNGVSFLVGFGGGSAIDAAKGISILAAQGGNLEDYYYPSSVKPPTLPVVAIPTTCGTGSEVTKYAVFSKNLRKNIIASDQIIPLLSLLDAEVLKHLPRKIMAHTVMDAFSHALESYFSRNSCDFSEIFVQESLKKIFENFKKGFDGDIDAREKLFYASMLAGFTINIAGTVIVHGLGYYLTERFGIPHGLANALFINQFIEYISLKLPKRTARLGSLLGITASSPEEFSEILIEKINELKKYAELPMSLAEAGVPSSELSTIIEQALSYKRNIENCMAPPTDEEIRKIVENAFRG